MIVRIDARNRLEMGDGRLGVDPVMNEDDPQAKMGIGVVRLVTEDARV